MENWLRMWFWTRIYGRVFCNLFEGCKSANRSASDGDSYEKPVMEFIYEFMRPWMELSRIYKKSLMGSKRGT